MTKPRFLVPGATYKLTRRCSERRCFLAPGQPWLKGLFVYLLAVLAKKHGILIHSVCVMSNHWHVILTDTRGALPLFAAEFHRLTTCYINRKLDRREAMWSQGSYSLQLLPTLPDVIDDCAYVITNPVAAGCVRLPSLWPGLVTSPSVLCTSFGASRPVGYFQDKGSMPKDATLELCPPPGLEAKDFIGQVRQAVRARISRIASKFRHQKRRFRGASACLKLKVGSVPQGEEKPRRCHPVLKCLDDEARKAVQERFRQFWKRYRRALVDFTAGKPGTAFPFGTFWLRQHLGVHCDPRPPDLPWACYGACS